MSVLLIDGLTLIVGIKVFGWKMRWGGVEMKNQLMRLMFKGNDWPVGREERNALVNGGRVKKLL